MEIQKVSNSRIETFKQCQYKFKIKYHDGITSTLPEPDYFEFGKFIHKAFELVVKNKITIQEASKIAIKSYSKFGPEYNHLIPAIFRKFERLNENIYKDKQVPEKSELEFDIPIYDFYIKGVIDRVSIFDSNDLIIDYKTTKERSELNKLTARKDGQLKMYCLAHHLLTERPIEKIYVMFFYVRSGNKVIMQYNEKEIEDFIQSLKDDVNKIRMTNPNQAQPNVTKLCNYCEYRNICKFYKRSIH